MQMPHLGGFSGSSAFSGFNSRKSRNGATSATSATSEPFYRQQMRLDRVAPKASVYTNAFFYCGRVTAHCRFHPSMLLSAKREFVLESNCYANGGCSKSPKYEERYKIYERIGNAFREAQRIKQFETIAGDHVLFANPFSGENSGHDLAIVTHLIADYRRRKLTCNILLHSSSLKIPRILELIELCIPRNKWTFVHSHQLYRIVGKCWVFPQHCLAISSPQCLALCHEMERKIVNSVKSAKSANNTEAETAASIASTAKSATSLTAIPAKFNNRKLILLKSSNQRVTQYVVDAVKLTSAIDRLTAQDWVVINPEVMPMRDIVMYCRSCTHVLVSHGAILYTQMNFINPKALLLVEHVPYDLRFRFRLFGVAGVHGGGRPLLRNNRRVGWGTRFADVPLDSVVSWALLNTRAPTRRRTIKSTAEPIARPVAKPARPIKVRPTARNASKNLARINVSKSVRKPRVLGVSVRKTVILQRQQLKLDMLAI